MTEFFDESVAKVDAHGKKVLTDHIDDGETLYSNPVKTPEQIADDLTPVGSGSGSGGGSGPRGATGPSGPAGPSGSTGVSGEPRWTGHGPPGIIAGSSLGDIYLDVDTGKLYELQ